jgi:hypothetical protein
VSEAPSIPTSPVGARLRRYLYRLIARYLSFFTNADARVLEIAPTSALLKEMLVAGSVVAYRPASGAQYPASAVIDNLDAAAAFKPDRIVLNGLLHIDADIQGRLEDLHRLCQPSTRLLIVHYSSLWQPIFSLARVLGLQADVRKTNWIAPSDLVNLLTLAGFGLVSTQARVLVPIWVPLVSDLINRWLAPLPVVNWFALVRVSVARPLMPAWTTPPSVSVVVPARNEAGNIAPLVERLPRMGPDDELIFVEGHSTDDTWAAMQAAAARWPERRITCIQQRGKGKGDAVRAGFDLARGEILMILDADLTVPPEELPKFYRARVSSAGEFVNGSRLVYPMEAEAMRFANMIGNKFFALAFSFLLGQPFKDTLCGTKVIDRDSYRQLASNRSYFGEFDPFGDFDLLFGAQRLGLQIIELPIRYRERTYGTTNIQRWRHGWLLMQMTLFAARRVKFI